MGGTFGKAGSFVLDHSMDNIPLSEMNNDKLRHGSIVTISTRGGSISYEKEPALLFETPAQKKSRRRSLWVAYTTMFVMSIGFSIVLTGVFPYMQTLNEDLGKEKIGWVIAANPLGQMLASPLLGIWGNKAGGIRIPCMVTVVVFIIGNAMYSLLPAFNDMGDMASYYAMIGSRFIVGVSSANVTLTRSYVAGATTMKERTTGIAIIAASQAFGFVVGPAIQALLTAIITKEADLDASFRWDKYTACSWVAAFMGLINLIVLLPCVFTEHNIAEKERALMKSENENIKLPKPDYIGVVGILGGFFVSLFIFTLLETLAEMFVTDMYGWDDSKALVIVGVALAVGGILSVGMFALSGVLAKKYDERKVLLFLGFPLMTIGSFLLLPWGNGVIPRKCENDTLTTTISTTSLMSTDTTFDFTTSDFVSTTDMWDRNCTTHGCPYNEQPWCENTPQLALPQLAVAYLIIILGYPVAQSLCQATFSKMLGPKPQGLWMGILTAVGSLSRILGPIFVSYVYTYLGTYYTFGILTVSMVVAATELLILFKRLIPMKLPDHKDMKGHDGPAAEKY